MLRICCAVAVAALALSGPAAAQTVLVEGPVVHVGPEFDGTGVTWGEEPDGATVVRSIADGVLRERARLPKPKNNRSERGFSSIGGDLAASPQWLGFVASTARNITVDGDSSSAVGSRALWFGPATAPRLTGRGGERLEPTAVAAEGGAFAWGETRKSAVGFRRNRHAVFVIENGRTRRFPAGRGTDDVQRVRLAGSFVGWSLADQGEVSRVVVVDRRSGRAVLRLRSSRRRGSGLPRDISDFDLQEDGTVVATFRQDRRRPESDRTDLGVATPAAPRLHTIARNTGARVRLAGGRVAYDLPRTTPAHAGHAVVTLAGGTPTVVPPGRPGAGAPYGRFDWDGRRLVWAEVDGESQFDAETGRIWIRDVP